MENFVYKLWTDFGDEVINKVGIFAKKIDSLRKEASKKFPDTKQNIDGYISGTVSVSDAKLLYLLVRGLKPKIIFEIGTWIGSSSMVMAEAARANGNTHIYTCDINDFYSVENEYSNIITRINKNSVKAIEDIPEEPINFLFIDGSLDVQSANKIVAKSSVSTVIALHDFIIPEKGVHNAFLLQKASGFSFELLEPTPLRHPFDTNSSIALLIPKSVIESYSLTPTSKLQRTLRAYRLLILYYFFRISKKI